jgi:WD40 repeat protein
MVATGSADSKIRVWGLDHESRDSELLMELTEHSSWVVALAYSEKEECLFSASADWSAKRWHVPDFTYQGELGIDKPFSGSILRQVEGLTQAEVSSLVRQGAVLSK